MVKIRDARPALAPEIFKTAPPCPKNALSLTVTPPCPAQRILLPASPQKTFFYLALPCLQTKKAAPCIPGFNAISPCLSHTDSRDRISDPTQVRAHGVDDPPLLQPTLPASHLFRAVPQLFIIFATKAFRHLLRHRLQATPLSLND